jgi:hypothetical protein
MSRRWTWTRRKGSGGIDTALCIYGVPFVTKMLNQVDEWSCCYSELAVPPGLTAIASMKKWTSTGCLYLPFHHADPSFA